MKKKYSRFIDIFILIVVFLITGCHKKTIEKVMVRQLRQIGTQGSQPGFFKEPRGLCFTPDGSLLVTDFRNYRVQKLTVAGKPLQQWGSRGNKPGQFNDPTCAAVDSHGNLFVVDTWNHRVQRCDPDGNWIENWAKGGDFYAPRGIAIDASDKVYVANTSFHNIKVFNRSGKLIATWGSEGAGADQFHDPLGLAFGPDGNLYVADTGNQRIKVVSPTGQTLRTIRVPEWSEKNFNEAYIAVGSDNKIYVTVPNANFIQVYTKDGHLFSRFGEPGVGPEQLMFPTGIAVSASGQVFISDSLNNRIVKYAPPPPLPTLQQVHHGPIYRIFSILRILIDIIAFLIIVKWWLNRRKQSVKTPGRFVRNRDQLISGMQAHPLLMFLTFCFALICMTGSLVFYATKHPVPGFWLLVATIILMVFHELPQKLNTAILDTGKPVSRRAQIIFLVVLFLITVGLRIYKLDDIPWGINNDAAWNGMYALRILDGEKYTPFTSEAWGKSTLYFYLIALAFKLFGVSKFALYLPCILAGAVTVFLFYFFVKYLFGQRLAMISSVIYSTMAWNITFSRTGYRAILSPLCCILTFWFYYKAVDSKMSRVKFLNFAVSGLFAGLGLHTYFAFRGIPLMLIIIGIHSWITTRGFMRRNWWGLLILLFSSLIAFSPLAIYAFSSPENLEAFMGRSDFLFIGNQIKAAHSLAPLFRNFAKNLNIFVYKAQVGNFFNNDWPIITRILAFFVFPGFALFIGRLKNRNAFFVVMMACFGILPAMLSEPDAARSIMVPISLAVFAGAGITSLVRYVPDNFQRVLTPAVLILFTGTVAASEFNFYFKKLGNDYFTQFGYARKHTLLGYTGLNLSENNTVFISQGHFIDTPKFLCYRVPGDVFKITNGEVIDVVPDSILMANLDEILNTVLPEDKGLAFIFENDPKNVPLFNRVQREFPSGKYKEYRDRRYGDDMLYYTWVIPVEDVIAHNKKIQASHPAATQSKKTGEISDPKQIKPLSAAGQAGKVEKLP